MNTEKRPPSSVLYPTASSAEIHGQQGARLTGEYCYNDHNPDGPWRATRAPRLTWPAKAALETLLDNIRK